MKWFVKLKEMFGVDRFQHENTTPRKGMANYNAYEKMKRNRLRKKTDQKSDLI